MSLNIRKVLISDNVDKKCSEILVKNGIEVVSKQKLSEDDLIEELTTCDGLVVRSETKVTQKVIESAKNLKVIGRAGSGVDNINLEEATKNGIIVLNSPTGNSVSACELTCSVITTLARNVPAACQSLKEGRWDRKLFSDGHELLGKTLAIIGLGKIGKEVALRMKSFGMKVVGFDPFVTAHEAESFSIKKLTLEEIWPVADYITVHTPLIEQTKNLINEEVFNKCKPGVRIVNVARGGIVNEQHLLNALKDGRCSGAALDVFTEEPPKSALLLELISHPKVIGTPHLGASTKEAQIRVAVEVAEQFSLLNDPVSSTFPTGIVNAPALLANFKPENSKWITLAEELGRTLSSMIDSKYSKGSKVEISLIGSEIKNKRFLSFSVLVGLLSGKNENGYNLINSASHAKEAGLEVNISSSNGEQSINDGNLLKISLFDGRILTSVTGTVIYGKHYLLSVNDIYFPSGGILLHRNLQLFNCKSHLMLQSTIDTIIGGNSKVLSISIAYGQTYWLAVLFE